MGTHSGLSERAGSRLFGPGSACRSCYLDSRRFELAVMSILSEESERSMSVHPACRFARIRAFSSEVVPVRVKKTRQTRNRASVPIQLERKGSRILEPAARRLPGALPRQAASVYGVWLMNRAGLGSWLVRIPAWNPAFSPSYSSFRSPRGGRFSSVYASR